MLLLQNLSFGYRNHPLLFENIRLSVGSQEKVALVGNNGSGKSTLLRIAAGLLEPHAGQVQRQGTFYYLPQLPGFNPEDTVADGLGISEKLQALSCILNGSTEQIHYDRLADDWTIEERSRRALREWGLDTVEFNQPMNSLSGGQRTKVLLAGISIHEPDWVLMDEPSNHLDQAGRTLLYRFIQDCKCGIVVVSHDRALLRLVEKTYELSKNELKAYGGNYDFYLDQKKADLNALREALGETEKSIRKAKAVERETMERQQRSDARGRKKQEKAGVAKIMMNTLRNQAEGSTAKTKQTHQEKQRSLQAERNELAAKLPDADKIRLDFDNSHLHKGKQLIRLEQVNLRYNNHSVWKEPINFQLLSGTRWSIKGENGSGKTSLLHIMLGLTDPTSGKLGRADFTSVYLDQHYQTLDAALTVYEQAASANEIGLMEHELKNKLNRFLFNQHHWDKHCDVLSGGERMRLNLCCISLSKRAPDLIVLDEPTNNLDLQNIDILTAAIADYTGTLVVVSHDQQFLNDIHIDQHLLL